MIISVLFCVVCVFFLGRLFYIQISGRQNSYDTGTTTQRVTVQAVRGEIYDRNGNKLVSNRYTYDLVLSHASFSKMTVYRSNEASLKLLEAIAVCGEGTSHKEIYFPFAGTYPHYTPTAEFAGGDSIPYYRFKRIVADLKLDENITPQGLVEYYTEKYGLLDTDVLGERLFTDAEVDRLLRLRYDMDALRFNASNDYKLAVELSSSSQLIPYVSELGVAGADFTANVTRVYEYEGYASHILGQVGPIYSEEWKYYNSLGYQMNAIVGKSGCELAFESYLRGSDGVMEIEVDSDGRVIKETMITPPISGKNVYLTIDIDLQIAAEDGLAENVQYVVDRSAGYAIYGYGCNAGAAVAMDPETFDVLAIASYPTYNLATFNRDYDSIVANEAKPLINRALNGLYEPGSTYKLGIAAAALMEAEISPSSVINCRGEYPYGSAWAIDCSTFGIAHRGDTGLVTAIAQSCNTFFCELGDRLGISKIEDYMGRFGFGRDTGLELGGQSGVLAGPTYRQEANIGEIWRDGNTWQAAIGKSDNQATPLQLATYVATLANGGTRYSAHLLHSVYEFGKSEPMFTFTQTEETVLDTIQLSDSAQGVIFEGMEQVIEDHSRIKNWLKSVPVTVGGKTGTAQNSLACDNALFVAAAPSDKPEIVISVVLEQGYMGEYAAMTAARILEAFYNGADSGVG
ncbi:MAG: hypothetical protein IJW16_02840 [Clostridia bacterium]|nr:hypothetical protein [Clostridia bacterium]